MPRSRSRPFGVTQTADTADCRLTAKPGAICLPAADRTCPRFSGLPRPPANKAQALRARHCRSDLVRLSPAHERSTSLGAALAGGIEYRDHQCALQLADRGGSARDRRCRTRLSITIASSDARRRVLMRWCSRGVGALPSRPDVARAFARSTRTCAALPRALCTGPGMAALAREEGCGSVGDVSLRNVCAPSRC